MRYFTDKIVIIVLALLAGAVGFGQSPDQNYVLTTVYGETNRQLPKQTITYYDGLGRPIETVLHRQSPSGNDIVTPVEYDAFGRQVIEFLPVTTSPTLNYHGLTGNDVVSYYQNPSFPTLEPTGVPYSEKELEASPLNRLMKQAAPGDDWKLGSGHEVRFDYQTNVAEEVRRFGVSTVWSEEQKLYSITFLDEGFYEKSMLYKTITKDENWREGLNNTTEEFKDKEGRVVLKRTYNESSQHDTYYVYDDYGNLTYVIPPAVHTEDGIDQSMLDNMCYQYRYDHRNRLVEKKLPGKQWEYIVYNSQDMPVATGPALNPWRGNNWGWLITKYDAFGRVVYTGWYATDMSRVDFQETVNATTGWAEKFVGDEVVIDQVATNYTKDVFPTDIKLLTVNYYDGYGFVNAPSMPSEVEGVAVSQAVKGLPTGNWVRILTEEGEAPADLTSIAYDAKGRVLGTYKNNYMGGYTRVENRLDFVGKMIRTVTKHKRVQDAVETTVDESFTYSPQDRLLQHLHKVNGQPEEVLVRNEYDELGQLVTKYVGGQDTTALQKVDYRYNIRGWMKSINAVEGLDDGDAPLDLFAFKINYNTVDENELGANVPKLYNGNIAETFWRTASDNVLRKYGYRYDPLNRLTEAIYQKPNLFMPVTNMYNESLTYDKNGNIQALKRNGDFDFNDADGALQIDDLTYEYGQENKNQLLKVSDATNNPKGFKDGSNDDMDYSYDLNGNMVVDKNKGITDIIYNHLNLPTQIIFEGGNKIEYLYDATGKKVRKTVTYSPESSATTDYLDGYQYTNGILNFFPHAEGYVNVTYCAGCEDAYKYRFNYVYQYKDHLGNIRLSYGFDEKYEVVKIIEENHYYPFGLKHTNYNSGKKKYQPDEEEIYKMKLKQVAPLDNYVVNNYKFQEQERQDELGLNWDSFKWRNYDYAIGRFMNIDPLAEKYAYQSTYNFSENQVVAYRELEGLEKIHFQYVFTKDQVSVTKTAINGPLGNGILVSSNHGGKITYYYGNTIASTLTAFKKAYEGTNLDKNGNHVTYKDKYGNPTIGYGHKIVKGDGYSENSSITEKEAQELFKSDSKWIIDSANEYLEDYDLNQNETYALYDASFNMGPGKMSQYTEDGSKFSNGNFFLQFMGGGDSLKKRRYAENILYNEGISVHLDVLKGKSIQQIMDYLNSLIKKDDEKK